MPTRSSEPCSLLAFVAICLGCVLGLVLAGVAVGYTVNLALQAPLAGATDLAPTAQPSAPQPLCPPYWWPTRPLDHTPTAR